MTKLKIMIFLIFLINSYGFSKNIEIQIIDKDIDLPLEGVKITITDNDCFYTDSKGITEIKISDEIPQVTLYCSLLGYEDKKIRINEFDKKITIYMNMENVMDGKELVIEEKYYTKQDKIGTNIVVDKEELKILSMRGSVEDVILAIKTLPGVSYSSGYQTDLSIRGGDTDEITASFDGFLIRYPFYWGSAVSIFNPNIVESAKFNNGVFSAKYGMAQSGLLEVSAKKPVNGFIMDSKLGISTFESYLQIPFNKKSNCGLILGGRVTYLDLTMGISMKLQGEKVVRAPYIYDSFCKWYFNPNDRFEWYINNFIGIDGLNMDVLNVKKDGINIYENIYYNNIHSIFFTGFKIMPLQGLIINPLIGYEFSFSDNHGINTDKGKKEYSDDFINKYSPGKTDFEISLKDEFIKKDILHSLQTKIDFEIQLHKKVILSTGAGLIYDNYNRDFTRKNMDFINKTEVTNSDNTGNSNQFKSSLYINFMFYPVIEKLEIELGCRVDHYAGFFNNYVLNTYPAAGPRFYIAYTPVRNVSVFEFITISLGTGLYCKKPDFKYDIDYPIDNFQVKQDKLVSSVIGVEMDFIAGFKIKMEGYYKFYFDRYYVNSKIEDGKRVLFHHSDGFGHVAGFDFILKKKISRYIDGWISYSFIYAGYFNPCSDGQKFSENGDPNGTWYYPSFHRWHSMNVIINTKPAEWFTISLSFGVHSGLPVPEYGECKMYMIDNGGELLELYSREKKYSDTGRTLPSFPLSIKFDFHFYFPKSRVRFETYFAFDNITALFWKPDTSIVANKYNGNLEEVSSASYETFLPSFGIKISY